MKANLQGKSPKDSLPKANNHSKPIRDRAVNIRLSREEEGYLSLAAELDGFSNRSEFIRQLLTQYCLSRMDQAGMQTIRAMQANAA